jgi:hypothetical protein
MTVMAMEISYQQEFDAAGCRRLSAGASVHDRPVFFKLAEVATGHPPCYTLPVRFHNQQ